MFPIKPFGDRIIVKRIEEHDEVQNGIVIPDANKEKPQDGVVIIVGEGRYENNALVPLDVKEGDRILFGKYSGVEVKLYGEDFLILRWEEVFGKYTEAQ